MAPHWQPPDVHLSWCVILALFNSNAVIGLYIYVFHHINVCLIGDAKTDLVVLCPREISVAATMIDSKNY